MLATNIKIDRKDRVILSSTHDNQEISQEEIAKKLHITQPSVAVIS